VVRPGGFFCGCALVGEPVAVVGPGGLFSPCALVGEPSAVVGPSWLLGERPLLSNPPHLLGPSGEFVRSAPLDQPHFVVGPALLFCGLALAGLQSSACLQLVLATRRITSGFANGPALGLLGSQRLELAVQDLGFEETLVLRPGPPLLFRFETLGVLAS
jgi:hypothetical protein